MEKAVREWLDSPVRILILYGPRQAGKTTLIQAALSGYAGKVVSLNADEYPVREALSQGDLAKLSALVQGRDLLFIDEAQRVPDIGLNLKILHDGIPKLRIIATGSSSFELAQKTGEPLTGRTRSMTLLPLGVAEWASTLTPFELSRKREEFIVYGMYPGLIGFPDSAEKADALAELANNYLYKDILSLGGIRHEKKIRDLVRLLAFQTGNEVSFTELGTALGMSKDTVIRYVDLLEKAFILFRSQGYSANLRNEITKKDKIYFYDTGLRNAVIDNFKPLAQRDDGGRLWENFLVAERRKLHFHTRTRVDSRFWRTHAGSKIDLIEESSGGLGAWEIKSGQKSARIPPAWAAAYPEAPFHVINEANWLAFLGVP
ncbi:MAG: ATP-binding protein [Rectinemataceae bacterium]